MVGARPTVKNAFSEKERHPPPPTVKGVENVRCRVELASKPAARGAQSKYTPFLRARDVRRHRNPVALLFSVPCGTFRTALAANGIAQSG